MKKQIRTLLNKEDFFEKKLISAQKKAEEIKRNAPQEASNQVRLLREEHKKIIKGQIKEINVQTRKELDDLDEELIFRKNNLKARFKNKQSIAKRFVKDFLEGL